MPAQTIHSGKGREGLIKSGLAIELDDGFKPGPAKLRIIAINGNKRVEKVIDIEIMPKPSGESDYQRILSNPKVSEMKNDYNNARGDSIKENEFKIKWKPEDCKVIYFNNRFKAATKEDALAINKWNYYMLVQIDSNWFGIPNFTLGVNKESKDIAYGDVYELRNYKEGEEFDNIKIEQPAIFRQLGPNFEPIRKGILILSKKSQEAENNNGDINKKWQEWNRIKAMPRNSEEEFISFLSEITNNTILGSKVFDAALINEVIQTIIDTLKAHPEFKDIKSINRRILVIIHPDKLNTKEGEEICNEVTKEMQNYFDDKCNAGVLQNFVDRLFLGYGVGSQRAGSQQGAQAGRTQGAQGGSAGGGTREQDEPDFLKDSNFTWSLWEKYGIELDWFLKDFRNAYYSSLSVSSDMNRGLMLTIRMESYVKDDYSYN